MVCNFSGGAFASGSERLSREVAYTIVQSDAMDLPIVVKTSGVCVSSSRITSLLPEAEIKDIFNYERYSQNVDFML